MFKLKITKPVGRYRSFDSDYIEVKYKDNVVGRLEEVRVLPSTYKVVFYVLKDSQTDDEFNRPWKSIKLKYEYSSLDKVRFFLKTGFKSIVDTFDVFDEKLLLSKYLLLLAESKSNTMLDLALSKGAKSQDLETLRKTAQMFLDWHVDNKQLIEKKYPVEYILKLSKIKNTVF